MSALMADKTAEDKKKRGNLPQNFRLLLWGSDRNAASSSSALAFPLLSCVSNPAVSCRERKREMFALPHMQKKKHKAKPQKIVVGLSSAQCVCLPVLRLSFFSLSLCKVRSRHPGSEGH